MVGSPVSAAGGPPNPRRLIGTVSVKRFSLVETAALSPDAFTLAAKKQWLLGTHRLSFQIVAAGAQQPLGSSPPQAMTGLSLFVDGLLVVPVDPAKTPFPLLIKVIAHGGNNPGVVLGVATLDPTAFFAQAFPPEEGASPMNATGSSHASNGSAGGGVGSDVGGGGSNNSMSSVTSLSDSFGNRRLSLALPVFPIAGLRRDTVHALIAAELEATTASPGSPVGGALCGRGGMMGSPSGLALEVAAGPLRLSGVDLYFPPYALVADGITVSNVLCACNVASVHLWVNVQCESRSVRAAPAAGLVLRPGQRAYFSVTYVPDARPDSPVAPGANSSNANLSFSLVNPTHRRQLSTTNAASPTGGVAVASLAGARVELFCVEVDTNEAHPPVALRVHDDAPRGADDIVRPYHLWLNGSCFTNRPLPLEEAEYVRGVLPAFVGQAASDGERREVGAIGRGSEYDDDSSATVVSFATAGVTPGLPWPLMRPPNDAGLDVRDRDTGAVLRVTGREGHVVPSSASRLFVDVANRACRCSIRLGRIAGSAIPAPRVCGPYQPAYRAVLSALHPTWTVERADTPIVLPHPATGDIDFAGTALVVHKAVQASPHQCLRVTLMEVLNAVPSGATAVPPNLVPELIDEVPIAVGLITLWPLHRSPMLRSVALSLLFLDTFARYDEMPTTGVGVSGSEITFVPLDTQRSR